MLYKWTISERESISDKEMTISGKKKARKEQKNDINMTII